MGYHGIPWELGSLLPVAGYQPYLIAVFHIPVESCLELFSMLLCVFLLHGVLLLTHVTQQKAFLRLRLQLFRFPASAELLSCSAKGRTFLAAWWIQNLLLELLEWSACDSAIFNCIYINLYTLFIFYWKNWTRVLDFVFFLRKVMQRAVQSWPGGSCQPLRPVRTTWLSFDSATLTWSPLLSSPLVSAAASVLSWSG